MIAFKMFVYNTLKSLFSSFGYEIQKKDIRLNKYLSSSNWDYQKKWVLQNLPKGGIILDLGSGHNPVPQANILADFFPEDTIHRAGKMIEDKPLIVCSVNRTPFLDKKIDFVICSHIIEHTESPIAAGNELARIAKAGYIETPAYGKDIIVGTGNMHNWQVVEFEGVMHFFEYSKRQREAHITSPAMELWSSKRYHPWQDYFWERQDLFNATHLWKNNPVFIEHRRGKSKSEAMPPWKPVNESMLPFSDVLLSDEEISLLEKVLATPDGKYSMKFLNNRFVNVDSTIQYPIRGKKVYFEMGEN